MFGITLNDIAIGLAVLVAAVVLVLCALAVPGDREGDESASSQPGLAGSQWLGS